MTGGSEEGEEDSENVDAALDHWDSSEKEKLRELDEALEIESNMGKNAVKDEKLKREVAEFSKYIMERTSNHIQHIQESAYFLTYFMRYDFGDILNDFFEIAGELELPEHKISGDLFKKWREMVKILDSYLAS